MFTTGNQTKGTLEPDSHWPIAIYSEKEKKGNKNIHYGVKSSSCSESDKNMEIGLHKKFQFTHGYLTSKTKELLMGLRKATNFSLSSAVSQVSQLPLKDQSTYN